MPDGIPGDMELPSLTYPTPVLLAIDDPGWTPSAISAEVGIQRATVYRIKDDPAKAAALLETWAIS